MASIQKILKKHQQQDQQKNSTKTQTNNNQLQQTCLKYIHLQKNNPHQFQFSNKYFPASKQVAEKCKFPFGFFMNPFPDIQDSDVKLDQIPRCIICKAYMNMYNRFVCNGNNFVCIFCNKQQMLPQYYFCKLGEDGLRTDRNQLVELHTSSYNIVPTAFMMSNPIIQDTFVFLIDVSVAALQSQMLFYGVNSIKQCLKSQQLNAHNIMIFTYDEYLHNYQFKNQQVKRIIVDKQINQMDLRHQIYPLQLNREKIFQVLDSLEDFAKYNSRVKSSFFPTFHSVLEMTKHMCPKIFILQANQLIITQQMMIEKKQKSSNNQKPTNLLQAQNRTFFTKYVTIILSSNISLSFFIFARNAKNLKILSDLAKLTNSQIFYYDKDSKQQSLKFYYQLYYLINATYLKDYKTQIYIPSAWSLSGIYGNSYRQQNTYIVKLNNLQQKKRLAITVSLNSNYVVYPDFAIQFASIFTLNKRRMIRITTIVKPLTNSLLHLYQGVNYEVSLGIFNKIYLSTLRLQTPNLVRNRAIRAAGLFYSYLKNNLKKLPQGSQRFFQGVLSFCKSIHMNIETCKNSYVLDTIIAQRNLLQYVDYDEINGYFLPYLFKISGLQKELCLSEDFRYPNVCNLSFEQIKQGIFVMDCLRKIYIYIGNEYNSDELYELLGVKKLNSNLRLNEQDLQNQNTYYSMQIRNLIYEIRARKYYNYIPLYIIHSNFHHANTRDFYLHFTNNRYQGFHNFNMTYQEFLKLLENQINTP